jgi:predicted O-methyltransferase YrrM
MKLKFKKYWRKTSLKKKYDGNFILNHILLLKPKNFLEIGVFHGVTSRNVCELLSLIHGNNFRFTGIDLFENDIKKLNEEIAPQTNFSNPLKKIYYKYIIKSDPYTYASVAKLLLKFKNNINIIKGNSNIVLKHMNTSQFDYVFLDGGHKYETVKNDLYSLTAVVKNNGTILCDDYNLAYAPGIKKAIDEYAKNYNFNLRILNERFAEITNKSM